MHARGTNRSKGPRPTHRHAPAPYRAVPPRVTRGATLIAMLATAALAVACDSPAQQPPDSPATAAEPVGTPANGTVQTDGAPGATGTQAPGATGNDAPLWNAEGLEAQRRVEWLRRRIPPELGFQPGTTPWRPAEFDLPPELTSPATATAAAPGILLAEFVRAIGWDTTLGTEAWEQTTRVLHAEEGEATGIVLRWGLMDDAIAGHDVRLRMREAPGGWYIAAMEERFHCSRGVTEEGVCL